MLTYLMRTASAESRAASAAILSPSEDLRLTKHLSHVEIGLALKLSAEGHTQRQIADRLNVSQPAICQVLDKFTDTTELAKLRLKADAYSVAEGSVRGALIAAQKGQPEAALELLDRLDVAPKRQQGTGGTQIQINLGQSQRATGQDPLELLQTQVVTVTQTE